MLRAGPCFLILFGLVATTLPASSLPCDGPGLISGFQQAVPFFTVQGLVDLRVEQQRVPLVIVTDTIIAVEPGSIALFDTSAGYGQVNVAPHRSVVLHGVPITQAVQRQTLSSGRGDGGDLVYHEWFPIFQLQENATLLLQDLVVHINPDSPLLKLCADQGVSASTALLAWLHVQESQSQEAVNAEAESLIEVAFAVLPQAVSGLCTGEVEALAPANTNIVLHNVTFQLADMALPAGDGLYLAESVMGLYPETSDSSLTVHLQTNISTSLEAAASVPYFFNRSDVANPEDNIIVYALPVHVLLQPFSSWIIADFSFRFYGGGVPRSAISYITFDQQSFEEVPDLFDMLTPANLQYVEGTGYGTAVLIMKSMTMKYDVCYEPVWARARSSLYKSPQVSDQLFVDGSGLLTTKNMTLWGASTKARYDTYGPSAKLVLLNCTLECSKVISTIPSITPPTTSLLGVPINLTQVTASMALLQMLTHTPPGMGSDALYDIGSSNIATELVEYGPGFSSPQDDRSIRAIISSSGEGSWSLLAIPIIEVTSGNLTLANFTMNLPSPCERDSFFFDHSVWVTASQSSIKVPGIFGTVLPVAFYVPGISATSVSNASLTLSNISLVYDYCDENLWTPTALIISAQPQGCHGTACMSKWDYQHAAGNVNMAVYAQAGLQVGFGNQQQLTCISCTFLGTSSNGGAKTGYAAIVQLFNTTITCLSLTTSAMLYDQEAAAAPIKFCKGSDPLTLPSGRVTSVGAELYGTDPIFFGKQMCDQDFGPAPPPDFTNRTVEIVGQSPYRSWRFETSPLPLFLAGPGTTVRLTRIHQQFSAYPFTADGQYLPAPQAFYAVAPNGTGSLLPTPLFLSLLPTSYSNLAGQTTQADVVQTQEAPSVLKHEGLSFEYTFCNAALWTKITTKLQSLIPVVVTKFGNSSQLYCPLIGGCNFVTLEPVMYVADILQANPLVQARVMRLRTAFFTEQLLSPVPYAPGTPQTLDFREQQPAASVSLQNVTITCKTLVEHELPSGLPVAILPDEQAIQATSDEDLVDAISYAGVPLSYPINVVLGSSINRTQTSSEPWAAVISASRAVIQTAITNPARFTFTAGQLASLQVAPGGALILAGLIIDMQQPSNTSLPPNMTQPIDVAWYDQGLKIPALFGTFLPDWLGFASELGFEGLPGYLDADAASMTLQSMQITYNTCSSAWTETAILLNTPAGGTFKSSGSGVLTCDPYQGCQLSTSMGSVHYQLSLINTTVICLHPAPLLHAIAFREFQPPLGVLIAICVLSPVITLAVTLWGVWALRRWALQPLKNSFHDDREFSKHGGSSWTAPKLQLPQPHDSTPYVMPAGGLGRSRSHSSDGDGAQLLQRVRSLAISRTASFQ